MKTFYVIIGSDAYNDQAYFGFYQSKENAEKDLSKMQKTDSAAHYYSVEEKQFDD